MTAAHAKAQRREEGTPWIIVHDGRQGSLAMALECLRCGEIQRVVLPMDVSVWCAMAKAFGKIHKQCAARQENGTAAP
jgi:hypothetical protein